MKTSTVFFNKRRSSVPMNVRNLYVSKRFFLTNNLEIDIYESFHIA